MASVTRIKTRFKNYQSIPKPQAPTTKTLLNPELTFSDVTGEALVTYCPETRTGGVYLKSVNMWRLYTPIEPDEFLDAIEKQGYTFP